MSPSNQRLKARSVFIPETGCYEWRGAANDWGYGVIRMGKRDNGSQWFEYAHRLAYRFFVGPIPADREIDHLCRNRRCWRPSHLEAVTHQVNCRRAYGLAA